MKNSVGWVRLASAMIAARADMRALYPAVELAARTGTVDAALVVRIREFLVTHGQAFTSALKSPGGGRSRQTDASWRHGGLWTVGQDGRGRGQKSASKPVVTAAASLAPNAHSKPM